MWPAVCNGCASPGVPAWSAIAWAARWRGSRRSSSTLRRLPPTTDATWSIFSTASRAVRSSCILARPITSFRLRTWKRFERGSRYLCTCTPQVTPSTTSTDPPPRNSRTRAPSSFSPVQFDLPEDVRLLKDTVRRFVDRELIPIEMHAMDGPDLRPEIRAALEAKTREMGLWLLDTPKEYGGQDLSLLALAAIWEEMARTVAIPPRGPSIFGPSVMSILLNLRPEQKEKYLLPVLRGEKTAAFAQTEPDAGSDPAHMRTRALRQGDHYVINGYKRFIQHAGGADFVQPVAVTDPEKGGEGRPTGFPGGTRTPGKSA